MRVSIYARISKDRVGAGLGVRAQEADCRELADRLGATIVTVHTDNDISAYSGKPRPGYRAVMREITAGKIDAVVVWHTDRLHRSPSELEEYISACEPRGVATYTVRAGTVDLATPSGRLMARQLGAHARYEVEHAIERMRRAKQRSADAGEWKGGRRPFGYEADGVTIREDEARLIRSAADAVLAGASLNSIARDWRAAGSSTTTGKEWDARGPARILLRPRNAGLMEHRGEIVGEASWPAIIEPEKWRSVARILRDPARRTNPGASARRWLGSGIYRCGVCSGTLRATQRGGNGRARGMYRCEAGHVARNREELDRYIEAIVVERLRRPDVADLLRPEVAHIDVRAFEARAIELRERLNGLASAFAEGVIDREQLSTGTRQLQADLEAVRARIDAAYSGTAFEELGNAEDAGTAWLEAPLDRKRAALDALLTVTVDQSPSGRTAGWKPGQSYFRPETVRIQWKGGDHDRA